MTLSLGTSENRIQFEPLAFLELGGGGVASIARSASLCVSNMFVGAKNRVFAHTLVQALLKVVLAHGRNDMRGNVPAAFNQRDNWRLATAHRAAITFAANKCFIRFNDTFEQFGKRHSRSHCEAYAVRHEPSRLVCQRMKAKYRFDSEDLNLFNKNPNNSNAGLLPSLKNNLKIWIHDYD